MLKYEKIIRNMSKEEKVDFLTTVDYHQNSKNEHYEFPHFSILETQEDYSLDTITNPPYLALASTWNLELVERFSKHMANLLMHKNPYSIFLAPTVMQEETNTTTFGADSFLAASLSKSFLKGASSVSANTIYGVIPSTSKRYRRTILEPLDICSDAPAVLASLKETTNKYIPESKFKMAICEDDISCVRAIKEGYILVSSSRVDCKKVLLKAIRQYEHELERYTNHEISLDGLNEFKNSGKVLDIADVDKAMDHLLEYFHLLEENRLKYTYTPEVFKYKEISQESIVLLKNEAALPIAKNLKIGLVGASMEEGYFSGNFIDLKSAFEKSTLKFSGFAHGYMKDHEEEASLVMKALELAKSSDVIILGVSSQTTILPDAQIKLIRRLRAVAKKLVVLVEASGPIDMSFEKYCDAILYSTMPYTSVHEAVRDILSGLVTPSGHLAFPLYDRNGILYPLGYGLSYTSFEYSNYDITSNGVSFTVKNVGEHEGIDFYMLYVDQELRGFTKIGLRRGESKRVVIPFDSVTFRTYMEREKSYGVLGGNHKVELASFDGGILYSNELHLEPKLYNPDCFTNEMVSEDLTDFTNTSSRDIFLKEREPVSKKGHIGILLFVTVLFYLLATILLIIADEGTDGIFITKLAMFIYAAFFITRLVFIIKKPAVLKPISQVDELEALVDSLADYKVVAKEKFEKPVPAYELTEELEELEEEPQELTAESTEREEAPEEPEQPVAEEEQQKEELDLVDELLGMNTEVSEEEQRLAEVEAALLEAEEDDDDLEEEEINLSDEYEYIIEEKKEEVEERKYALDVFGEEVTDNLVYSDVDITGVALDFQKYAQSKGLTIELESARSLFAGLVASHIIFLKTSSPSISRKLASVLERYLGNTNSYYVGMVSKYYEKFHDLVWTVDENGDYAPTDLLNFLLTSNGLPKHMNVMTLYNVNMNTLTSYFKPFIRYSASPSDKHKLDLQIEGIKYYMPNNIYTILIPQDPCFLEDMPTLLLGASVYLELNVVESEAYKDPSYKKSYFSYFRFHDEIRLGKEQFYIEEDTWKKLDDFEDGMAEYEGHFRIGNKKTLAMERMASFLFMNGSDKDDVLDTCFMANIVPILKTLKTYQSHKGDEKILELIDKIFGLEILPKTARAIKKPERVEFEYEAEEERTVEVIEPTSEEKAKDDFDAFMAEDPLKKPEEKQEEAKESPEENKESETMDEFEAFMNSMEDITPVEEAPVEEPKTEEALDEEAIAEETPVIDEPVAEETIGEEATAEEVEVEEAPAEEAPEVDETPVEEVEVEETQAEETIEETPSEEVKVEDSTASVEEPLDEAFSVEEEVVDEFEQFMNSLEEKNEE